MKERNTMKNIYKYNKCFSIIFYRELNNIRKSEKRIYKGFNNNNEIRRSVLYK